MVNLKIHQLLSTFMNSHGHNFFHVLSDMAIYDIANRLVADNQSGEVTRDHKIAGVSVKGKLLKDLFQLS